ncbi:MAG: type II secretion system protein [Planctomycetes bacterium]|nr:type II secretion system protein [Planctomycetota bacterium]
MRCPAFTLVEIMVSMLIVSLLVALLFPMFANILSSSYETQASFTISAVNQSFSLWKLTDPLPYPDGSGESDPLKAEYYVGHLRYGNENPHQPGIMNILIDKYGFSYDGNDIDSDTGYLVDAWGQAIHFVRGDNKNRLNGPSTYDSSLPHDLNKPLDNDIAASETDWNSADVGAFCYVWSEGEVNDSATWIYYRDQNANKEASP